jgi:2,3-bisphosphoglycerate-dependent phosphoglycerate mutase
MTHIYFVRHAEPEFEWADFDFHEEGGESLSMVQQRNIEALLELISTYKGKNILLGTQTSVLYTTPNCQ